MRVETSFVIRQARPQDAVSLAEIERSAARAFRQLPDLGWTPGSFVESVEEHLASIARGTLWVAESDASVVGFLTAEIIGAELHIDEFDVHLDHQRRGIGRKLIAAAVDYAQEKGLEALTLTTFRDVPWNAPFYGSVGFRVVEQTELSQRLRSVLEMEVEHGQPRGKRCAMRMKIMR